MPFFGNKFSPKKPSSRKSFLHNSSKSPDKLIEKDSSTKLALGDYILTFQNGKWVLENGVQGAMHKALKKQNLRIQTLEEENNLLKLKLECFMNMLTETTIDSHIQQREIEKLKTEVFNN
ncbi:protein chibby homolog 1-like [Agrilus planipennis]|uniref:Protein chibby homolog 1-like n=1 Tax=Agrilus planipennis TaxID=224129 RepID=A0A1W4X147_AGRPL|nr:protein chibby homolog 1-like [Agrilus planipennis]